MEPPAKSLLPNVLSIREHKAIDTLINIGLLIDKRIDDPGLCGALVRYYDSKGELLLTKHITQWNVMVYEVYRVSREEFTDDLNYEQIPKLLVATTTVDRINIEHYIPGAWEVRLQKLAEDKLNGKDRIVPKIEKPPRTPKRRSKKQVRE